MYRKGKKSDKQDILDFLNYVFSMDHEPTDFRELLPKIYAENSNKEKIHHLIVEEDRIKAAISLNPFEIICGKDKLKAAYIGSVAVHPYEREKGFMRELMQKAAEEIQNEKYDLAVVSGQRQRYEHFGFYRGGCILQYHISEKNLTEFFQKEFEDMPMDQEKMIQELELSLSLQEEQTGKEMEAIYQIYQSRVLTGRKAEDIWADLNSFHARLFAVNMHGVCIGYVSFDEEEDYINEITLIDANLLPYVLQLVLEYYGCDVIGIKTTRLEPKLNAVLTKICERYTVGQAQMYRFFHYEKIFTLFLQAKKKIMDLQDGSFVLEVKQEGKFLIQIKDGAVQVKKTTQKPLVSLTEEQVIRILFSPDYHLAIERKEAEGLALLPHLWFPLPLGLLDADTL